MVRHWHDDTTGVFSDNEFELVSTVVVANIRKSRPKVQQFCRSSIVTIEGEEDPIVSQVSLILPGTDTYSIAYSYQFVLEQAEQMVRDAELDSVSNITKVEMKGAAVRNLVWS